MNRFRPSLSTLVALASLSLSIVVASCGSDGRRAHDGAIWFVHATDPHIYKAKIDTSDPAKLTDPAKKSKLQQADEDALTALFQKIPGLPQTYGPPAFLLITGDFGMDPCEIPELAKKVPPDNRDPNVCLNSADKSIREAQIKNLAALLAKSPVPNIYFVAGNNDVPREAATTDALKYFNKFFTDVQAELETNKSDVKLVNLTSCYADPQNKTGCSVDVLKTDYTVIGFPSQTFKNRDGANSDANKASLVPEASQIAQFRDILGDAVERGRKILIVTHIPELDDPFLLGVDKYGNKGDLDVLGSRLEGPTPGVSAWNVTAKMLEDWKTAVASNSVVAVFAGHLHDSHQEAYRRPYSWSTQTDSRIALNKLYLAPPLSMKKQDNSIFQARGFSTITLFPNSVQQRLYWYDGLTATFTPDPDLTHRHTGWFTRALGVWSWFWNLDSNDGDLERTTVLLIALLAAFLTIIAVWQLPPSDNPLLKKPGDKPDGDDPKADPSPFTTKLGKTVIGGVGGFVFTDIAKTLCSKELSDAAKCFYLVWFILFFFLLLLLSAVLRGLIEAIRSRVAVIHYPLARPPRPPRDSGGDQGGPDSPDDPKKPRLPGPARLFWRIWDWLSYWFLRIVNWVISLKVPLLTFSDTFFNLIQGKNQTTTQSFTEVIIDQQKTLLRTVDAIRRNLNQVLELKLLIPHKASTTSATSREGTLPHVRVNISVLSADQSSVFYIATSRGSALLEFPKRSVAWVAVFTGLIRWWWEGFQDDAAKIVLFDNSKGTIAGAEEKMMLSNYYQDRAGDYGGFVIIPLPFPQRSYSKYVKGAIHISLRERDDIFKIWEEKVIKNLQPDPDSGKYLVYPAVERILADWCKDDDVRAVLQNSVYALSELLFGFNEIIYKNYIHPDSTS